MSDVVKLFSLKELSEARKQGAVEELERMLKDREKTLIGGHWNLREYVEKRLLELKK